MADRKTDSSGDRNMNLLLVNPPIYDFAAYNFWLKPYGLLQVASALKTSGASVLFFDFCDTTRMLSLKKDPYGRSKFEATVEKRPALFSSFRRRFRRYGLPRESFARFINQNIGKRLDSAFVSSSMTYWYLGVFEVVKVLKEHFGERLPIYVGGTYAALCYEHLRSHLSINGIWTPKGWLGEEFPLPPSLNILPADFSVYENLDFGVTRLSRGCPFKCTYCASTLLEPEMRLRPEETVLDELRYLARREVKDVAFYDDSLLIHIEYLKRMTERLKKEGIRFRYHTPNGVHSRFISLETAKFLKEAGFETLFIGYECADSQILAKTGDKVRLEEVKESVKNLLAAGFTAQQVTLYVLAGHPDIPMEAVEISIREGAKLGVRLMLAEYSPIPNTPDGENAFKRFRIDGHSEPLLTNNTFFTELVLGGENVQKLKEQVRSHNRTLPKPRNSTTH
ncbi:MAG: radical SAM protein [Planctomycetota bacterium]|nr:radical SAM protein [Planctomycetota bacterium]